MFFKYHRSERNGTVALLLILVFSTIGVQIYSYLHIPEVMLDKGFLSRIDSLEKAESDSLKSNEISEIQQAALFHFNPNQLSDSGFSALGFSEKEIQTLRKYMGAGATFRIKSDFSRLYFLSDSDYSTLEPFIDLPEDYPSKFEKKKPYKKWPDKNYKEFKKDTTQWSDTAKTERYKYKEFICNLNFADTTELKKLPYIGPFYAKEIVRYRSELGGYYDLGQLLELYKMRPETIDIIADKVWIDKSAIRKINLNTATAQELSGHPYIDFKLANKIILKRESGEGFENMEQLCQSGLLNADLCLKLAPYLEF